MGFFEKLFAKQKPKSVEVELGQAADFLEKELAPSKKHLLEESAKTFAEIKHLLKQSRASLQLFREAGAASKNNRLDKIVKTAKRNALLQLASLLEKLSPPNVNDLAGIKAYCSESTLALRQAGSFGKNVAYAGISFKDEVKALGAHMKRINQLFVSLQKLLDENKPVFLQDTLQQNFLELRRQQLSASALQKQLVGMQSDLGKSALQKRKLEAELQSLRSGAEFRGIGSLNEKKAVLLREKQHTKTQVLDLFAKIEKPLHRLDKAVRARRFYLPGLQAAFLHELLLNPFRALKRDPKAETVKQILLAAREAIESGAIELKEREREKKLAGLQELISFDFFSESFWKFNRLDSEILAVEKQLAEMPAVERESELLSLLRRLHASEEQASQDIGLKRDELEKALTLMQGLKLESEKLLQEAAGRPVVIKA